MTPRPGAGNLGIVTERGDSPPVVIPAGLALVDAARWVGHSCWAELRLHEVLTGWLAIDADPESVLLYWRERADAAERAHAWHQRLPELRERPKADFVVASSEAVERVFNGLAGLDHPAATGLRCGALSAVLRGLRVGYHRRQPLAAGPADGPLAATIAAALRSTFDIGFVEPDRAWVEAIDEAGGLP